MAVCLNHIDRQATVRCFTCFKPLCAECALRRGRKVFCSTTCRDNFLHTSDNLSRTLNPMQNKQRRRRLIKWLILLLIMAVVLALLFLL